MPAIPDRVSLLRQNYQVGIPRSERLTERYTRSVDADPAFRGNVVRDQLEGGAQAVVCALGGLLAEKHKVRKLPDEKSFRPADAEDQ